MSEHEDDIASLAATKPSTAGGHLQVKDAVVLVPLFGSLLAMTWEAGQFYPTGGFRLFSLSEHLLSAIGALPITLMAASS